MTNLSIPPEAISQISFDLEDIQKRLKGISKQKEDLGPGPQVLDHEFQHLARALADIDAYLARKTIPQNDDEAIQIRRLLLEKLVQDSPKARELLSQLAQDCSLAARALEEAVPALMEGDAPNPKGIELLAEILHAPTQTLLEETIIQDALAMMSPSDDRTKTQDALLDSDTAQGGPERIQRLLERILPAPSPQSSWKEMPRGLRNAMRTYRSVAIDLRDILERDDSRLEKLRGVLGIEKEEE